MLTNLTDIMAATVETNRHLLIEEHDKAGFRTSGYTAKNTTSAVSEFNAALEGNIFGPKTWKFLNNGRGPNRRRGRPSTAFVEIIRQWIAVKGIPIPLTAAGAIAYKIVNEGIKVPNKHNPGNILDILDRDRIVRELKRDSRPIIKQDVRSVLFLK